MIKAKIVDLIKKAIREKIEIEIFVPENDNFGHYSTNVALKLATLARTNADLTQTYADKTPIQIAKIIIDSLNKISSKDFFEKIEIAPPGFINFWLSEKILQNELKEILKKKEDYGRLKAKTQNLKPIQIEYISANPTGPLTLANGRGGFMGDVLSNILEFCGYKVEREYYINDVGNQILTLGKSILAVLKIVPDEENFYKGGYIKEWATKNSSKVKKFKSNPMKIGQMAAADFLKEIKSVIKKSGINFSRWTSEEKDIHKKSYIEKVLDIFKKAGLTYEKDGALWLKTTGFGDEKDRVLITQDKFPTYFLADTGHFLETKKRGFGKKIMILGPDHHGYVKRIQAAAKIIGIACPPKLLFDDCGRGNFEIIITQAMRLMSKGKEVKISKRSGEFITFEELIKEIGADAARFFFLMHSADTHMDFNLDLAKERSMKNPVYYAQYAFVRAQSILTKANFKFKILNFKLSLLNTYEDINLMRILARFSEIIEEAAEKRNPQILARYSLELARQFHNFYEKERIINEKPEIMATRLILIQATLVIFKNIFKLLGINMPRKM